MTSKITEKTEFTRLNYKKQRQICGTLVRKAEQQYFSNLEPNVISNSKKCWKTVKPSFSDKIVHTQVINLTKNDE